MNKPERSRLDLLLDLLAEEVAERLKTKAAPPPPPPPSPRPTPSVAHKQPLEPEPEPELPPGRPHTARLMGRMMLGLLAMVVLINVPINRHGTTLATAMPDSRALIIHDGLVVTEEDDE